MNYLYLLRDRSTGEILKYGVTVNLNTRYSASYLARHNAVLVYTGVRSRNRRLIIRFERSLNYGMEYRLSREPWSRKNTHLRKWL